MQSKNNVLIECEVLDGLKPYAVQEIKDCFPSIQLIHGTDPATIRFEFSGDIKNLANLRTIVAAHLVESYAIPRPKAFLGHQHFTQLQSQIKEIIGIYPPNTYQTFTISAAGKDSSTFQRIREEISAALNLSYHPEEGDLLLRFRRSIQIQSGWDVLVRVGSRPFSTRPWRVFNMEGALNGTVAAAIMEMTHPSSEDRFLNLMSGSGTFLIERELRNSPLYSIGLEIDWEHLLGAKDNISAAESNNKIHLTQGDTVRTPFPANSFDVIVVDLPWGQLVGTNEENERLYPAFLDEMARIAAPGARAAVLTHSIRLFESTLERFGDIWNVDQEIKIKQGGLHPRIYLLSSQA